MTDVCGARGVVGEAWSDRERLCSAEGTRRGGRGDDDGDADPVELPWRSEKYAGRLARFRLRWLRTPLGVHSRSLSSMKSSEKHVEDASSSV